MTMEPSRLLSILELTTPLTIANLCSPSCLCSPISTAISATAPSMHMLVGEERTGGGARPGQARRAPAEWALRLGWLSCAGPDASWQDKVIIPAAEAGPDQAGMFHGQKGTFLPSLYMGLQAASPKPALIRPTWPRVGRCKQAVLVGSSSLATYLWRDFRSGT